MRQGRWAWGVGGLLGLAVLAGCSGANEESRPASPGEPPVVIDDGLPDGPPVGPGEGSAPEASVEPPPGVGPGLEPAPEPAPVPDPDVTEPAPTGPVLPPTGGPAQQAAAGGWTFLGSGQNVPSRVWGASADRGGNLWVAGGDQGVFVMRPGEGRFRQFSVPQRAISIAGGEAGVAYVGYEGHPECADEWDRDFPEGQSPDPAIYKSGDADRLVLGGSGLTRAHYDISSGPGVVRDEPRGREKICTILRIVYEPLTRSVWFGANHGVSWGDGDSTRLIEHTHPAINGYRRRDSGELHYTFLSGDWPALAVDARGDLWLGGRERTAKFRYGTNGRDFWASDSEIQRTKLDVWPDAVPQDPRPEQEVPDRAEAIAVRPDGTVWVGSRDHGLAVLDEATGRTLGFYTEPLVNRSVLALATDPLDGSVWMGHPRGGLTRLKGSTWVHYTSAALGARASSAVRDIQVDTSGPRRRILVSFQSGAVCVYEGD